MRGRDSSTRNGTAVQLRPAPPIIKRKAMDQNKSLEIGYIIKKSRQENDEKIIDEIELIEFSLIPCDEDNKHK